jgi:hypothetical protein
MLTQFLFEKVGNSEKSSEALKIQNWQFQKREGFGIRSAPLQGQPNSWFALKVCPEEGLIESRNLLFFQIVHFEFSRLPMIFRCFQLSHIRIFMVQRVWKNKSDLE